MSQVMTIACPDCGLAFELTPDYLQQYGGDTTHCTGCQRPFMLPGAETFVPDEDHDIPAIEEPTQSPHATRVGQPMHTGAPTISYEAAEFPPVAGKGVWSDGWYGIISVGAEFPPRCIKCNAAAHPALDRVRIVGVPVSLSGAAWALPLIYIAARQFARLDFHFLLVLGIYAAPLILLLLKRIDIFPSAHATVRFCPTHRAVFHFFRVAMPITVAAGFMLVGISMIAAVESNFLFYVVMNLLGWLMMIAGTAANAIFAVPLRPVKIDRTATVVTGFGPKFLRSLTKVDPGRRS